MCFCETAQFVDEDFQRRLDQILLDVKSLEDLINEIQSPKTSTETEVNEKIKVRLLMNNLLKTRNSFLGTRDLENLKCLLRLEISIREKHRILMRSVLSADKTPHTNKEEVYRYKVIARDVLSTI